MKKLTIGQKVAGGFTILILLAGIVGGVSALTMRQVRHDAEQMSSEFVAEASLGTSVQDAVERTQLAARSYSFTTDDKFLGETKAGLANVDQNVARAEDLISKHPNLVKLKAHLAEFAVALKDYKVAFAETEAKEQVIAAGRDQLNVAAAAFVTNISTVIGAQNQRLDAEVKDFSGSEKVLERHRKLSLAEDILRLGDAARISAFKAQALRDPTLMAEGLKGFTTMEAKFDELNTLLKTPADIAEMKQARTAAIAYRDQMATIMTSLSALEEIGRRRVEAGNRLETHAGEIATAGMQRTVTAADDSSVRLGRASLTVQVLLGVSVILGCLVAFLIIRVTNTVLRETADSLIVGSEQIVSAAGQVSASSQNLAAGASEQASSLEETTASIEELSSMTKSNAASAENARELARTARMSADESAVAVGNLTTAMSELKASNSDVAKIVKSIDEIAFQTNLLALNAAVEAARAGEAGAGFAVVAEEVRSLAHRSAEAAKETAQKIEHAVTKSEDGARISNQVATSLSSIIEQVRKLDTIVTEITNASKEQSQGIGQVSDAVVQIDKVTQSNAAAAEESASAAEELNAQAAELNKLIANLLTLVGGRGNSVTQAKTPAPSKRTAAIQPAPKSSPSPARIHSNGTALRRPELVTADAGNDQFFN